MPGGHHGGGHLGLRLRRVLLQHREELVVLLAVAARHQRLGGPLVLVEVLVVVGQHGHDGALGRDLRLPGGGVVAPVVAGDPHPDRGRDQAGRHEGQPGQQPAGDGRRWRARRGPPRARPSRSVSPGHGTASRPPARRAAARPSGSARPSSTSGCSASYAARAAGSRRTFAARLRASKRRSPGSRSAIWDFQAARISSVEASRGTSRTSYQVGASLTACSPRSARPGSLVVAPVTGEKSSTSHSPSITTRSTRKRNGSGSWSTVVRVVARRPARSCR